MLWLCLKVATGEPLWEFPTCRCGVLYLCLEDTYNRIQNRLFQITDTAPDNLHFAIVANQIDTGLQAQIGQFIDGHTDTRLVVIDTLQRVRGISLDCNAYANDYRDITVLKELADHDHIALVVVHHLRKQSDRDPFLKVSGTTGLTGAVDSTMVLDKDRLASDTAKLYITGRDVEYQELTLQFRNCVWRCIACEKPEEIAGREIPDFLFRLVDFISQRGEWNGCASELLAEMADQETPVNTVTKLLNQYHSTILAENGITYEYKRTGKGRSIRLIKGDGCDSCDSNIPTGKEPSLPSPTVTGVAVERGVGVSPTTHLACKV